MWLHIFKNFHGVAMNESSLKGLWNVIIYYVIIYIFGPSYDFGQKIRTMICI